MRISDWSSDVCSSDLRCPVEDWSHPDETRDLIWIAAAAPEHISNSSTNISAMIMKKGAPTMALRQPSIRTYSCGMASACSSSSGSADDGSRAILYRRWKNVASLKGGGRQSMVKHPRKLGGLCR